MVNIAVDYGNCNLCKKGNLVKLGEREISKTTYVVLRCDKCNHQVARSMDKNGR
ncbi:MAG: hypothetical protein KKC75_05695 [Nanoarchaeota archaeon]|nr:hypothetical protein [Nanoarchaeota archaeon]MBU1004931.1 hypothetical protein [Nanoarchaeota archaeon]MBU1945623.1 hypothetical protein [Nanoarchaeota archaeon]